MLMIVNSIELLSILKAARLAMLCIAKGKKEDISAINTRQDKFVLMTICIVSDNT